MTTRRLHPVCAGRPRCHATPTWETLEPEPCVLIALDGTVQRFTSEAQLYWCDEHVPMP